MAISAQPIPVIDSHHHLWDLETNPYPLLRNPTNNTHLGDNTAICKTYSIDHFNEDVRGLNVVKSVHIECGWEESDWEGETHWVQSVSDQGGFPNAIVPNIDLFSNDAEHRIDVLASYSAVRGVRSRFLTSEQLANISIISVPNPLENLSWRKAFSHLQNHHLTFDLQAPSQLMPTAKEIATAFPNTLFVLTHAGLPLDRSTEGLEAWKTGMRSLAELDNVYVKISGLGMTDWRWTEDSLRPIVLDTIDIFEPDKCMFGSNFPVDSLYATYTRLLTSIRSIIADFSIEEQQQILNGTASTFYRI